MNWIPFGEINKSEKISNLEYLCFFIHTSFLQMFYNCTIKKLKFLNDVKVKVIFIRREGRLNKNISPLLNVLELFSTQLFWKNFIFQNTKNRIVRKLKSPTWFFQIIEKLPFSIFKINTLNLLLYTSYDGYKY